MHSLSKWAWLVVALAGSTWPLAAEEAIPTSAQVDFKDRLDKIFTGEAPRGVEELKAMQVHVQTLTKKLLPSTVGVQIGQAWGSGVIVSKDGYVLTAAHVAGQPNRPASFVMADGRILHGKTLGLNRTIDAGLMKITDAGDYPFLEMGSSDKLKEGQWCVAVGHPGGYQRDRGMVLRVGRVLLLNNGNEAAITSDCTLVGGDSGGPLFDMEGRVIGINSRIAGSITANLHVPVNTFRDTWDRLVKAESWGHFPGQGPVLGVRGEKGAENAKIAVVVKESPAEKAGVKVGDIVVKLGSKEIANFPELMDAVREHQPEEEVTVRLKRGDEEIEVRVKLGRQSDAE